MIESIYSVRSFSRCLRKGFGYIFNNPWLVTRVMGPWALALSIVTILYFAFSLSSGRDIVFQGDTEPSNTWIIILLYILMCIVSCFFTARLIVFFRRNQARIEREEATRKLNEGGEAVVENARKLSFKEQTMELIHIILDMLPYTLWMFILVYITANSSLMMTIWSLHPHSKVMMIAVGCIALAFVIALCIFLPPLCYTFYATMMKKDEKGFISNYKLAFKYKGRIFGLSVMATFIASLICILPSLPIAISQMAYTKNVIAKLLYDEPAIIPTSGYTLMIIVCIISYTIATLFTTTIFSTLLYQFGSIYTEQQEKEMPIN